MKQKLLMTGVMLAVLASLSLSVQPVSASDCYLFDKIVYGPGVTPPAPLHVYTYYRWECQIHINVEDPITELPATFAPVVVTDKFPAEIIVEQSSFRFIKLGDGGWGIPPGDVDVEQMGKGKAGAKLVTWTVPSLGPGYYILRFYVHTWTNPAGKVGFTSPGRYMINYGAKISFVCNGIQYFDGPTPEVWVTVVTDA